MNSIIRTFFYSLLLLPLDGITGHAADAPDVDQSVVSMEDTIANQYNMPAEIKRQIEHYLLLGVNISEAHFHSKYPEGWPGEGFVDSARNTHDDTSYLFGYGIELQSNQFSGSHAIEISFSPNLISGSEFGNIGGTMFFDIENQFNLEYNHILEVNKQLDVLPLVGISNFDFTHQQESADKTDTSDFETQNVTEFYLGAGIRTNINNRTSLKLSYKLYNDFFSDLLTDPNGNYADRDPAIEDFSQVTASLIYRY